MKVVLDCNVLIAAGITSGVSRAVFEYILINCEVYASKDIIQEYSEVISRNKFIKYKSVLEKQLYLFTKIVKIIEPKSFKVILPDQDDIIYINLALEIKAKYLITGNLKHFPEKQYQSTKIISPREFYDKYVVNWSYWNFAKADDIEELIQEKKLGSESLMDWNY